MKLTTMILLRKLLVDETNRRQTEMDEIRRRLDEEGPNMSEEDCGELQMEYAKANRRWLKCCEALKEFDECEVHV